MLFLIDENLPAFVGKVFASKNFGVRCVGDDPKLRGKPDEVVFDYAVQERAIIVTRDLEFSHPARFNIARIDGLVILRFPNEISISKLCSEVSRLIHDFNEKDFKNYLTIIEPGSIRRKKI